MEPLLEKYPVGVQDLDKSAALMMEAGWEKNAEGFWEKDGTVFEPNWSGFSLYNDIGPALCEQFVNGGFKVEYKEDPQLFGGNIQQGLVTMHVFGIACDTDVYESLAYFHSSHYAPTGENLPLGLLERSLPE